MKQLTLHQHTRSLATWHRYSEHVAGGVASSLRSVARPHPLFFDRGAGSRMWDVDGNEYIDYLCAFGPMVLGHSHPAVVQAVLDAVPQMQMNGMCNSLEVEAAEAVLSKVPSAEKMLWSNTGTEAVQVALRLARAHTGRNRFVKFAGAYHGWHDSVYLGLDPEAASSPIALEARGQSLSVLDDLELLPFNDVDALSQTLAKARELDLAAVIIDPINSSGGVIEPSAAFLETMRELCDAAGVVLIFDEVITGFRVALGGASERWGVTPDLWTLGKAMAGGFSQSAVLGRADLIDITLSGSRHGGTYNGNPVAMAAVKASMEALSAPGIYAKLDAVSGRLVDGMNRIFAEHGAPLGSHRVGSMVGLHGPGIASDEPGGGSYLDHLCAALAERGVFMLPIAKVWVSMAHTDDDVDQTLLALANAVTAVTRP